MEVERADVGGRVVEVGEDVVGREAAAGQREGVLDEAGAGAAEREEEGELLEELGERAVEVGVERRSPQIGERVGAGERGLEEGRDVAEPLFDLGPDRVAFAGSRSRGRRAGVVGGGAVYVRVDNCGSPASAAAERVAAAPEGVNREMREEAAGTQLYAGSPARADR